MKHWWHPALTDAAERSGTDRLKAARTAKPVRERWLIRDYERGVQGYLRHSNVPAGVEASRNLFALCVPFGMLPYAASHGHLEVVVDFMQRGAPLETTGLVRLWRRS